MHQAGVRSKADDAQQELAASRPSLAQQADEEERRQQGEQHARADAGGEHDAAAVGGYSSTRAPSSPPASCAMPLKTFCAATIGMRVRR